MALPPTLPTSFVPRQPTSPQLHRARPAQGLLYYVAIFVMVVALLGAGGTFAYAKFLETVSAAKEVTLKESEDKIDGEAVLGFTRLRSRILVANNLLDRHVVTSRFFEVLEDLTLQNVRFQSMQMSITEDRTAKIEMRGVARSFNALAAQSSKFAGEPNIRRAIFSGITVDKSGFVKFSLQAELTPKLVIVGRDEKNKAVAPTPNIATTTPFEAVTSSPASTTTAAATTTKP